MPRYWLIKSEPSDYGYPRLEQDRKTSWTGIRNFEARNNLRQMAPGDLALYYHTGDEKQVVAVARICSPPQPDRTAKPGEDWVSVDLEPLAPLTRPVTLAELKATPGLALFPLISRGRLSVASVSPAHFRKILALGKTKL